MILYGRTILKLVGNEDNCRVWQHALSMFEPDEVKVSCPVLRGLGTGNSPRLPGGKPQMFALEHLSACLIHIKYTGHLQWDNLG